VLSRARPTASSTAAACPVVTAAFPPYEGMQRKTRRKIPVVIIEPVKNGQSDTT
jgi:hypothetical protein